MKTTRHAETRMQQRAISDAVVQRIIDEGVEVSASGGATFYRIPEELCKAQSQCLREEARLWEQAAGKAVLVEGGAIITVMPRYKKLFQE